jgi:hypothetical protein
VTAARHNVVKREYAYSCFEISKNGDDTDETPNLEDVVTLDDFDEKKISVRKIPKTASTSHMG